MEKPQLYTIENPQVRGGAGHVERKLEQVGNLDTVDKNKALKEAQENLLSEKMYIKFLQATLDKDEKQERRGLCQIENIFISHLQNLSNTEIESVIRQFNTNFKRFVADYKGTISMNTEQRRKIFENDRRNNREIRGNIHPNSIISVIDFIRNRKVLLELNPSQRYTFYTESHLDAHYGIDLIECLYLENGDVGTMNLIQIKSSEPDLEALKKISRDHRKWITSCVMDMEMFEQEYTHGIPEGLTIETFSKNADEIEELLLDMCTREGEFDPEPFIKKLDLGRLSNKHKAWLLIKYGAILKDKITTAVSHEMITEPEARVLIQAMNRLEDEVEAKAKMPKNLAHIHEVNSITTVGPRVIRKELIFPLSDDTGHKKIIKVV